MKQVTISQDPPMSVEETFDGLRANINIDINRYGEAKHTGLNPRAPKGRVTVYAYIHGGVLFSDAPFSCRWDSGVAGFIEAPLHLFTKANAERLEAFTAGVIADLNRLWSNDYFTVFTGNASDEDAAVFTGSLGECIKHCDAFGAEYTIAYY
jgi:hypothetical protein